MPESNGQAWRRWFGLVFLALAFGMLIWGQTVLKSRLEGLAYLIYWSICFLFTLLTLATAILDIILVRRRSRRDRRELIKKTIVDLEALDEAETEDKEPERSTQA